MYVDSDTGKNEEAEGENEAAGGGGGHCESSSGAVGRKGRKDVVGGEEEDHRLWKWSDLLSVYLVAGLSGLWYQWVLCLLLPGVRGFYSDQGGSPTRVVYFIPFFFFLFNFTTTTRSMLCQC